MEIANFEILKNPANWLTVWLMVILAAIVVHLVFVYQLTPSPAAQNTTN